MVGLVEKALFLDKKNYSTATLQLMHSYIDYTDFKWQQLAYRILKQFFYLKKKKIIIWNRLLSRGLSAA
jgi:hypothetical protein